MKKLLITALAAFTLMGCEDVKNIATEATKDVVAQVKTDVVAQLEDMGVTKENFETAKQYTQDMNNIIQEIKSVDLSNPELSQELSGKIQNAYACLKSVAPTTIDTLISGMTKSVLEGNSEEFFVKNIEDASKNSVQCTTN